MFKKGLILFLGLIVLSVNAPLFAQEEETKWVWGEVLSLDTEKNEIKVKYLNYETDEEKEITIACDSETKFENISSIDEIRIGDYASIDYIAKDDKNIAMNISIEKVKEHIEEAPSEIQP